VTSSRPGFPHGPSARQEEGPSVSELAEKIKALKAANTIEATPQRVRQKHSTAEEPVTARIRRRTRTLPCTNEASETFAATSINLAPLPSKSMVPCAHEAAAQIDPSYHASVSPQVSIGSARNFQERVQKRKDQVDVDASSFGRIQ
jgi:hypothetical protein